MKKTILISLCMVVLLLGLVSAALEYEHAGIEDGMQGTSTSSSKILAQQFTAITNSTLTNISAYITQDDGLSVDLEYELFNDTGANVPDEKVSDCTDMAPGSLVIDDWNEADCPAYNLTAGEKYWVVIKHITDTGSSSNRVQIATNSDDAELELQDDGGDYPNLLVTSIGEDFFIRVYSNPLSTPTSTYVYNVTPANNTQFNSQSLNVSAYYNLTTIVIGNSTCRLYIDDVLNETIIDLDNGNQKQVNFSEVTLTDGTHNVTVNCYNAAEGGNSTTNIFYIDTENPTISTGGIINNSLYLNNNLELSINLSDSQSIFSYNISIDGVDVNNTNNILATTYNFNWTYPTTSLSPGEHTLSLRVADGHTAKELKKPYKWSNGLFDNYLKFEMYDESDWVEIRGKENDWWDSWQSEGKVDRYNFKYKPNNKKATQTFTVIAGKPIEIIDMPESKYNKWLIIGEHWLDFMPYKDVTITRIKENEVEVTINNLPLDEEITFNSIGDLNIITQNYTFYTTNASTIYSSPVTELTEQTTYLNINKTGDITSTAANFTWNGTAYSLTKLVYPNYDSYKATFTTPSVAASGTNVSLFWNYSIFSATQNYSGNVTENQTILKILFDNCSVHSVYALNWSLRDDTTENLVVGDVAGYFEMWTSNRNDFVAYNLTWNDVSNGSICINDSTATYNVYSQMEFNANAGDYETETHYLSGIQLTNDTQNVTFYLTENSTRVTFTVTDQDDTPVSDVYIYIQKYDLTTDSFIVTEILKTDQDGEAIGNVILNTQWYKFMLVKDNINILNTDPIKLTALTRNFRVQLIDKFTDSYELNKNVTRSLTYNNATGNFIYTFLNPAGTDVTACLSIKNRGVLGDIELNSSCVTSSSGTIILGVANQTTGVLIAVGTVYASPKVLDTLIVDLSNAYKQWGPDGVFLSFFVRITILFVGIWNPFVGILFLLVGDILLVTFGFMKISLDVLIIYIILGGWAMMKLRNRD